MSQLIFRCFSQSVLADFGTVPKFVCDGLFSSNFKLIVHLFTLCSSLLSVHYRLCSVTVRTKVLRNETLVRFSQRANCWCAFSWSICNQTGYYVVCIQSGSIHGYDGMGRLHQLRGITNSIGDRASPCFKPFLIGNLSHTFLPTWTLLHVSVRLIFINLTSFLGIQKSMRILYKTSLLIESYTFLKSMKS